MGKSTINGHFQWLFWHNQRVNHKCPKIGLGASLVPKDQVSEGVGFFDLREAAPDGPNQILKFSANGGLPNVEKTGSIGDIYVDILGGGWILMFFFPSRTLQWKLVKVNARRGRSRRSMVQPRCPAYGCILSVGFQVDITT